MTGLLPPSDNRSVHAWRRLRRSRTSTIEETFDERHITGRRFVPGLRAVLLDPPLEFTMRNDASRLAQPLAGEYRFQCYGHGTLLIERRILIQHQPPLPGAVRKDYRKTFFLLLLRKLERTPKNGTHAKCFEEIGGGYRHWNLLSAILSGQGHAVARIAADTGENVVEPFYVLVIRVGKRLLLKCAFGARLPNLHQLLGVFKTKRTQ